MNRKMLGIALLVALVLMGVIGVSSQGYAQGPIGAQDTLGTTTIYQGTLEDGGTPANGSYDFGFKLYDASAVGNQVGSTINKTAVVNNGQFSVGLDFGTNAFNGQARYLQIEVRPSGGGSFTTLTPRQELTAVPYALHSRSANVLNAADGDPANAVFVDNGGKVGINTNTPTHLLTVYANELDPAAVAAFRNQDFDASKQTAVGILANTAQGGISMYRTTGGELFGRMVYNWDTSGWHFENGNTETMVIRKWGVGIGKRPDTSTRLDVNGNVSINANKATHPLTVYANELDPAGVAVFRNQDFDASQQTAVGILADTSGGGISMYRTTGGELFGRMVYKWGTSGWHFENGNTETMVIRKWGVGIGKHPDTSTRLDVNGTTRTHVLQITGGADLAEPFEITGEEAIEPGMVVAIDPERPGQLRLADTAYDHTVAGVISGAGGVNPGLTMQQDGIVSEDAQPVALTGRVYVWADATGGPIHPGDLLTTSDIPGHAMAVTDYERAQGAILGKAMSGLDDGQGLVLVLVSLQ